MTTLTKILTRAKPYLISAAIGAAAVAAGVAIYRAEETRGAAVDALIERGEDIRALITQGEIDLDAERERDSDLVEAERAIRDEIDKAKPDKKTTEENLRYIEERIK